jgi:hypothetical protein
MTFPPLPAPFDGVAPTLIDPSGTMRVWLTDPPGMLDQAAMGAPFTTQLAHWLTHDASAAMQAAYGSDARYTFLHEWRGITTYTTDARLDIIGWGRKLGMKHIERIDIVLAPDAGTLFRMAAQGGSLAMTVIGVKCGIADSIEGALASTKLKPRSAA